MVVIPAALPSLEGRNIHLSVDLGYLVRHTRVSLFDLEQFSHNLIDQTLALAGPHSGVMVSAFNFDFGRSKVFDVRSSPSEVGRFSEYAISHPSGERTVTPFYSFVTFGSARAPLIPYPYVRSTGVDSPFDFQVDQNYVLLCIGHHLNKALTLVHHSENVSDVPWRYEKLFDGKVRDHMGVWQQRQVNFYVRSAGVSGSFLTIEGDEILRADGVIQTSSIFLGNELVPCEYASVQELHYRFVNSLTKSNRRPSLIEPVVEGSTHSSKCLLPTIADRLFHERQNPKG